MGPTENPVDSAKKKAFQLKKNEERKMIINLSFLGVTFHTFLTGN